MKIVPAVLFLLPLLAAGGLAAEPRHRPPNPLA